MVLFVKELTRNGMQMIVVWTFGGCNKKDLTELPLETRSNCSGFRQPSSTERMEDWYNLLGELKESFVLKFIKEHPYASATSLLVGLVVYKTFNGPRNLPPGK